MTDLARTRERSTHLQSARAGKHVNSEREAKFPGTFNALGALAYSGAQVSASVVDLQSGRALVSIDDRIVLPTASVGKVLLLIEVAARLTDKEFTGYGILDKAPRDLVGDSGIWQHLQAPSLPIADLATLVGATSDNLATNLLIGRIGLEAVRARTESIGLSRTALLDVVRDHRGPDHAPQLSVGSTAELAWLFGALARGEIVDPGTSQRVIGWLALNTDLSMVASAFGLDPLAHRMPDHSTLLVNKTGTDAGVRSEAGALKGERAAVAYAVTVHFADTKLEDRLTVLAAMRTIGEELLDYVH